jgi:glycosyltransferase involved in cell wall biosynthesis
VLEPAGSDEHRLCAIVASDTPPVREAIRDNDTGRLVDFFDVAGLTDAICAHLADPAARERLGGERAGVCPGQLRPQGGVSAQAVCIVDGVLA